MSNEGKGFCWHLCFGIGILIFAFALYLWSYMVYMKGYVYGSTQTLLNETAYSVALFEGDPRIPAERDDATIKKNIKEHIKLSYEELKLTAESEGIFMDKIEDLGERVEQMMQQSPDKKKVPQ